MTADGQVIADIYVLSRAGEDVLVRECVSFEPGATVGQVWCIECSGSGWWGYGPVASTCGPCVDCKGTGRVWVGLS